MRIPHSTQYQYTDATLDAARKLGSGTIAERDHKDGLRNGEPLIVAMDALLKYAQAYRVRYECGISEDGVLGDEWLAAVKGVRGLLNGDGAIGLTSQHGLRDSKDNGCVESVFWAALDAAGYTEATAEI